jgi:hypothetical protein
MDSPFRVTIYDGNYNPIGFLVDSIYENWVPGWYDTSYGNFSIAADNPHIAALQTPGARVTVVYQEELVLSGPINSWQGDVMDQVIGDKKKAEQVLWFPVPSRPLNPTAIGGNPAQLGQASIRDNTKPLVQGTVDNQYPYYQWPDGVGATAETAIKHAVKVQMVDRLGLDITILPDQRRGPDVTSILPDVRFDPLTEVLFPMLDVSGLEYRIWQDELTAGLKFDVVSPGSMPQPLTTDSGIILEGSYTVQSPSATRAIVGGPGETSARIFDGIEGRGFQTDAERKWFIIRESFRDKSSGTDLTWPTSTTANPFTDAQKVAKYYPFVATAKNWGNLQRALAAEEQRGLQAGAQTTSFSLKLAESETFFYGKNGYHVGDRVTIVIHGQTFTDQIARVYLTYTRDSGIRIEPEVGDFTDDPDTVLAKFVTNLAKALRRTTTSK